MRPGRTMAPMSDSWPMDAIPVGPRLMAVLEVAYRARQPVLLEGPTGIGKSEVVAQLARTLGVRHMVLDLSLLEPPDLVGLPRIQGDRTGYAAPEALPAGGEGILLLEELNRAERYIQQPALQLLTARRLHQYELPPGWSTMAAINPEDGDYQVTPLDPALRTRFMNLRVLASRGAWLQWAEGGGVHPAVLKLARLHDRILDDVSPRNWTYASNVLKALSPAEIHDTPLVRDSLGGYLPAAWVDLLIRERDEGAFAAGLDAYALLHSYHREPDLQAAVREQGDEGRLDRLEQTGHQLMSVLRGPELALLISRGEVDLAAFEALVADLPGDLRETLSEAFGDNPAAASLLDVTPRDVLKGYPGSHNKRKVDGWMRGPRHRARALLTALAGQIRAERDPNRLRRDNSARLGLGAFLEQIGIDLGDPLVQALRSQHIDPIFPSARR